MDVEAAAGRDVPAAAAAAAAVVVSVVVSSAAADAGSVRGCFGTVADMLKAEYAKGARYIHLTMFRYKKALNMVSLA